MSQDSIRVVGLSTGAVITPNTILNSVSFDLSAVDLGGRTIVAATLHLPSVRPRSTVAVTDPSEQANYGRAICRGHESTARVQLSAEAVRDLRCATGWFFSVNTVVRDEHGGAHRLASVGPHFLALSLAQANRGVLASDPRAAA
jgi:hypothetical protein